MTRFAPTLAALLALTACGSDPEPTPRTNEAEDFAARINGGGGAPQPAPQGTVPPKVVEPLPNAAEGAFTEGTATDPASATCGANRMGRYLGRKADLDTRRAIVSSLPQGAQVRFLDPGSLFIRPDPSSPRLNLMLDATGVIRDARCG